MGRRRRKIIKKTVRPFPKVFVCPICNEQAVTVYHEEGTDYAKVVCANCGASATVRWLPSYMPVDAYAEFYDIVTGAKRAVEVTVSSEGSQETVTGGSQPGPDSQLEGETHEKAQDRED